MGLKIITYIAAGYWGRRASGPDYHGDTTGDFYELFSSPGGRTSYTMTYEVYCLVDPEYGRELDDMSNVTVTGRPEPCVHGEKKYVYCEDGTKVMTAMCVMGSWFDTKSDCSECTNAGSRTKVCLEPTGDLLAGTEIVTHRCVGGKWVEIARCREDAECWGEGDEKKIICEDGTEIVTHICVNWEWVPTGDTCPGEPEPPARKTSWAILGIGLYGLYKYLS